VIGGNVLDVKLRKRLFIHIVRRDAPKFIAVQLRLGLQHLFMADIEARQQFFEGLSALAAFIAQLVDLFGGQQVFFGQNVRHIPNAGANGRDLRAV
jgi:hypothetical protein